MTCCERIERLSCKNTADPGIQEFNILNIRTLNKMNRGKRPPLFLFCSAPLYSLEMLAELCAILKLIECAFDFVVDSSVAYNDGFLTECNSSSLGAKTTTVTSLWTQLRRKEF